MIVNVIARVRTLCIRAKYSQKFNVCSAMPCYTWRNPVLSLGTAGPEGLFSILNVPVSNILSFVYDSALSLLIQAILMNTFDQVLVSSMSGT